MRRPLGAIPTILLMTGFMFGLDEPPPSVSLFDGKTLEGWSSEHTDSFAVRDGLLVSNPGDGWLKSAKPYQNFELQLEFRIVKDGAEGGLFFRASAECGASAPYWPARGYQVPITDGDGDLMLFGHGTNPPKFERKTEVLKAASRSLGEWQKLTLKAVGPRLEVSLNEALVTVADGLEPAGGHLGLYDKAGQYEWKELSIRVLPD